MTTRTDTYGEPKAPNTTIVQDLPCNSWHAEELHSRTKLTRKPEWDSKYLNPYHTAIYIGNGQMISADSPAQGINIESIWGRDQHIIFRTYTTN